MKEQTQPQPSVTSEYGAEYFTGIRASGGDLTIGNVIGAVNPILDQQEASSEAVQSERPLVFVADMHAFTDQNPQNIVQDRVKILKSYLALGIDPEKTDIFIQSQIMPEVLMATTALNRYVTLNQIARVPTLKDKINNPHNASMALAAYPVMMAADIILQRPRLVPTGKDQQAHLEFTRDLVDKVNLDLLEGVKIPRPEMLTTEPVNILALRGMGKMSKTSPQTAIFMSDSPELIQRKIKKAQTAISGETSAQLESLLTIGRSIARHDEATLAQIELLYDNHLAGEAVMGRLKNIIAEVVVDFVREFQKNLDSIDNDPNATREAVKEGAKRAKENARKTLDVLYDSVALRGFKE